MKSHYLCLSAAAVLLSASALAAGDHAGTHGNSGNSAIGKPGVAAKVTRTVTVDMRDDMRFHADVIRARKGETIRFIAKNSGKLKHEMVLGAPKDLKEHAELMKKHPGMEHDDPNMVTVEPGKTGEIIWQFTTNGKVDFACLQPGHFDAGMKGQIHVSTK
jgi:uncharacterized cupredoxin-like copper-binding protein